MRHRSAPPTGFTLIELLVALAIAGLLALVALPAWTGAGEAARASAAQAALLESFVGALDRATVAGTEVVLCPGAPGGCRDSFDWSQGWVAFADLDGDRRLDAGEPVLKAQSGLGGHVHLRSTTGRRRLVIQPNGGNAGSNVTFTLCDGRGPARARALVIANDGRLRASPAGAAAAAACMRAM